MYSYSVLPLRFLPSNNNFLALSFILGGSYPSVIALYSISFPGDADYNQINLKGNIVDIPVSLADLTYDKFKMVLTIVHLT
jgi:hypothetical protein